MLRVLPLLLLAPVLCGDTAVRDGGMQLSGRLSLSKTGQLHFTPDAGRTPDDIVEYRLTARAPLFSAASARLLTLSTGEKLTGVLLGMEKDKLVFRTAWKERLEIPRDSIRSLTHLPGWQTVFSDDFTGKLVAWTVKGSPTSESSVLLKKPGQSLTHKLARPIAEGRIGVNFLDAQQARGARWIIEATFARKDGDRTVRVTIAGPANRIESDTGIKGTAREVARTKTLRRLLIDWSHGSLRLSVDDQVLWFTLDEGPGGSLKEVRLACVDLEKAATPAGAVAFSAFAIEKTVAEQPHPPGDTAQDELWLADGDQLFGQVIRVDAKGVEIKGRFGTRRYAWTELRGWFARQTRKPVQPKAPVVRVGLHGGLRREQDELIGTLTALDAKEVKVNHPILGALTLPRERVAWLRPVAKATR